MFTGLSLDQAPPFKAPLKFFITAPIFAIIASLFLIFSNSYEIHSPSFIAALHLLTIGYLVMIIFGALLQMLPVVAGAVIPKPMLIANITYFSLIIGLIFFVEGFYFYSKTAFFISAISLLLALFLFTFVALYKLIKVENKSYIVKGMIFSLTFFILAFLVGIHLVISHATGNISELHFVFTSLHYNYIFFGFILSLIVSISFQVVPMFWVASSYSDISQKIIIYTLTTLLILLTFIQFSGVNLHILYKITMVSVVLYFAIITIKKLRDRKRKLQDFTVNFYLTSMISLILGSFYWLIMDIFDLNFIPLGILFGIGFTVSLMNGMLYKIIPFLTWFHLSSSGLFDIPTMRDMIPQKMQKIQFRLHLISLVLMFFAFSLNINIIIKLAVLIFMISNILLFINIYKVAKLYFKASNKNM